MRHKLLLAATSLFIGALGFACDDDDTSVIDQVATEVGGAATAITGELTELAEDEDGTPSAGGAEGTETPDDCPMPDSDETPDPEATVPAGCPTPEAEATP